MLKSYVDGALMSTAQSLYIILPWCLAFTGLLTTHGAILKAPTPAERQNLLNFENSSTPRDSHENVAVCSTMACERTAKKFLDSIDPATDPCSDFYQYACGNWIAHAKIPDDETAVSQFTILSNKTLQDKIAMFSTSEQNSVGFEVKARKLFQQCLNQEPIENLRSQPILDQLEHFIGGWPLITPAWNPDTFDAFRALTSLHLIGSRPFISLVIGENTTETSENVLNFGFPATFTSVDILNSSAADHYVFTYTSFMENVTGRLMKDTDLLLDVPLQELEEIIQTEIRFAEAGLTAAQENDDDRESYIASLGELQANSTFQSALLSNFTNFVHEVFSAVGLGSRITNDTLITIYNLQQLDVLDDVFAEYEQGGDEGKRKMANHIGWKFISQWLGYASSDYRNLQGEYAKELFGQASRRDTPRNEECVGYLTSVMPLAVGAMYVRNFVPKATREKTITMTRNLKQGFRELLNSARWMDNQTRSRAVKKLNAMLTVPGYPDIMVNDLKGIDDYYKAVTMEPTFFETYLNYLKKVYWPKYLRTYARTNPRYDPYEMTDDITGVGAANAININLIEARAGILQPPFFDAEGPQYMNYGGIGYVLGHEITHGFDSTGANYDDDGNRRSWWSPKTRLFFDEKKLQMIWQYGNYTTQFGKVDGFLTQGENIADNGGIKAAHKAYVNAVKSGPPEPKLPGLETFSPEKLFFLSFAQVWCEKERPEVERYFQLTDEHAPSRFRANGVASNSPEFAQAFSCPLGSPMNPITKTVVW